MEITSSQHVLRVRLNEMPAPAEGCAEPPADRFEPSTPPEEPPIYSQAMLQPQPGRSSLEQGFFSSHYGASAPLTYRDVL